MLVQKTLITFLDFILNLSLPDPSRSTVQWFSLSDTYSDQIYDHQRTLISVQECSNPMRPLSFTGSGFLCGMGLIFGGDFHSNNSCLMTKATMGPNAVQRSHRTAQMNWPAQATNYSDLNERFASQYTNQSAGTKSTQSSGKFLQTTGFVY